MLCTLLLLIWVQVGILVVPTLTPSARLKVSAIVSQVNVLALLVTKAKVAAAPHAPMTALAMAAVSRIASSTHSMSVLPQVMKPPHLLAANFGMLIRPCNVPVTVDTVDMTVPIVFVLMATMF
jgi:hypothetical protein